MTLRLIDPDRQSRHVKVETAAYPLPTRDERIHELDKIILEAVCERDRLLMERGK